MMSIFGFNKMSGLINLGYDLCILNDNEDMNWLDDEEEKEDEQEA